MKSSLTPRRGRGATPCPACQQGAQRKREHWAVFWAQMQHAVVWGGTTFPCILPRQLGIYSWGSAAVRLGYKAWANPDIDLPLLQSTSLTPPMALHTQEAINSTHQHSLSQLPLCQRENKSLSGKGHHLLGFLPRTCAWLLPLPCSLPPPLLKHSTSLCPWQVLHCWHRHRMLSSPCTSSWYIAFGQSSNLLSDLLHPGKAPS